MRHIQTGHGVGRNWRASNTLVALPSVRHRRILSQSSKTFRQHTSTDKEIADNKLIKSEYSRVILTKCGCAIRITCGEGGTRDKAQPYLKKTLNLDAFWFPVLFAQELWWRQNDAEL